ncbi:MAG: acetylglutamate kinase [Flavobacteriaceae bacterium]|nr:acetylglutamate kinase [Flavobacteriaceae bacterium]
MSLLNVVKIGGAVIENPIALEEFLDSFVSLQGPKILVHGGGRSFNKLACKLSIPINVIDGRRITSKADLELAAMIYRGKINIDLVSNLSARNIASVGLSGADGNIILATKRTVKTIDYGYVGDVLKINTSWIYDLLYKWRFCPIICALAHDQKGQILNINADTIARELACALSHEPQCIKRNVKVRLIFSFEKRGVLYDASNDDSLIEQINQAKYQELIKEKKLSQGILPKIHNGFEAMKQGIDSVLIGNLAEFTKTKKGTVITP